MRWAGVAAVLLVGGCQEPHAQDAAGIAGGRAAAAQSTAVRATGSGSDATPPAVSETNRVVLYIKAAELQFETPEQGAELRRALTDMLTLSPAELCARRYEDYGLTPARWTLGELLRHYVVTQPLQTIPDEPVFCKDATAASARATVSEFIRSLDEGTQPKSQN
jgi:hypothetical protein